MSENPLNIVQVLEPSGGGSGRHFVDLCAGLTGRGHSVRAIYSPVRAEARFVDELKSIGLDAVHAVPMTRAPSPSDPGSWRAINRIVAAAGRVDILHGHSSKAGALTRIRLPGRHVPRVYTPHAFRTMDPTLGSNGRQLYGTIESLFGRWLTDALICVSEDERHHARNSLRLPTSRLHVIVNGVTSPRGDKISARHRLGLSDNAFVYGAVGRLSAQKAPERLISAFARIAGENSQAELIVIGSGELEGEVRQQIAASGFGHRIQLRSDLAGPEAMQAFDVLVMPSRYEAMSYVMLEAAAAGLPLILSDVGGASTVLEDGVNGLLVANSDDVTELAAAMARLADPCIHDRMLAAAGDRKHRYGLDTMVDETEALYRSLVR